MTYIYALEDPNTGEIRYVGKADNPKARLSQHMSLSGADVNRHKKNWLRILKRSGQKPHLVILEKVAADVWEDRERFWIQHGKDNGWPLTNIADGGVSGYGTSDALFEMIKALALYLDESERERLEELGFDTLKGIALEAAQASIPLMAGYFSGKADGRAGHLQAQFVIRAALAEL